MFATSAPYVIVILVSVMSWTASTFYSEMRVEPYLRYEKITTEHEDEARYIEYRFRNVSPKARVGNIRITFSCAPADISGGCFIKTKKTNSYYANLINIHPWAMGMGPSGSEREIIQEIALPPQMAFGIEISLRKNTADPIFLFSSNQDNYADVRVTSGFDLSFFLIENFLIIVLILWSVASVALFIIYVVVIFASYAKKNNDEADVIQIKIVQ